MRRLVTLARRIRRKWHEGISDAEMHYKGLHDFVSRVRQAGFPALRDLRILDVGCGDRAPLSLLLAGAGARVVAIDLLPVHLGRRRPLMWMRLAREGDVPGGRSARWGATACTRGATGGASVSSPGGGYRSTASR